MSGLACRYIYVSGSQICDGVASTQTGQHSSGMVTGLSQKIVGHTYDVHEINPALSHVHASQLEGTSQYSPTNFEPESETHPS